MFDRDQAERNLVVKQAAFFTACAARGYSVAVLSVETGIPVSTLASYIDKPSRKAAILPLSVFNCLARKVPADIASLLIEDSEHRLCPFDSVESNWAAVASDVAGLVSDICSAQADGRVDHVEALRLKEHSRRVIGSLQGVVA